MTMELLAVPPALAHISGLVICPECVGGVLPARYVSVKGSALEHAIGPECASCRGTGIDPQFAVVERKIDQFEW